jgi:16S rRNA (uracil1498-N3)-methyltransferase
VNAPRFHIEQPLGPALRSGGRLDLPTQVAHHAVRVLRLRDGDAVTLFDGGGGEYAATLEVDGRRVAARLSGFADIERESPLSVTLLQSWVATDKLDWIVEKATELGAASLVLVPAERSVVRLQGERLQRRLAHLQDVIAAACCQCGRNRLPALSAAPSLDAALSLPDLPACRLLLAPQAAGGLAVPGGTQALAVAVGPEGGFSTDELARAQRAGFRLSRLGPRVLRTESAGLAALAALQALRGDLA